MPNVRIDIHIHFSPDFEADGALNRIQRTLDAIQKQLINQGEAQQKMEKEIVDLVGDVASGTTVQASVFTLVKGMAKKIEDLSKSPTLSAEDRAALVDAHMGFVAQAKAYADAVVANTPAAALEAA